MAKYDKEIGWIKSEKYHNQESNNLKKDIKRLEADEPVDYIIGFKEFLGAKIDLSYRPLIPRLETEYWVERAITSLKSYVISHTPYTIPRKPIRILDLFSGSGCIGISLLLALPSCQVDFAEIDEKFIKQIKKNVKINKIKSNRYKIIQSDIFSNVSGKYNYIFANPPYISEDNIKTVEKSVLNYEPKKAVFAQDNGLFYIKKFLLNAPKYLAKNDIIYMEFDCGQKDKIEQICRKIGYKQVNFYQDQFKRWRYLRASY
jgi:release factor glutamine methyltransferase